MDTRNPNAVRKGNQAELEVIQFARDFLGKELILNEDTQLNYKGCDLFDKNDPNVKIDVKSYDTPVILQYTFSNQAFSIAQPFREDNISTHIYIYNKSHGFAEVFKTEDYKNIFITPENLIRLRKFYEENDCSKTYNPDEFKRYIDIIFWDKFIKEDFFKPGIRPEKKDIFIKGQITNFKIMLRNLNS